MISYDSNFDVFVVDVKALALNALIAIFTAFWLYIILS